VLITAAVAGDVPAELEGEQFVVEAGQVSGGNATAEDPDAG
jgi:hypothetical protein